jgi:signal transduction histidine kinase
MTVSEPLGVTVRTRYDTSAIDGFQIAERVSAGAAVRRARRPAQPARRDTAPSRSLPSSAIHELRTPLTSIHGYAQMLQRGLSDNPRAANGLAVIVRESGRLTQMLAELSDLADLNEPDAGCDRGDVDVRALVEIAAETIARHDTVGHAVTIGGQARLVCDGRRLAQAITHVLTNATRYSPPDSRIAVRLEDGDDFVRIYVADEGIGICEDDAERVYQPFQRGANAREFGTRGLGLGLLIARLALAVDRGTLTHTARPSVGTLFVIELPRD